MATQKINGRAVLLGDNVRDQDFSWAELCELGSSPPSMEAAKALAAMGTLPGYVGKTGYARGAYTQSLLNWGCTWVALPDDRWLKQWAKQFRKPAVRLAQALYGHADAGGFWEEHCEGKPVSVGFERIAKE